MPHAQTAKDNESIMALKATRRVVRNPKLRAKVTPENRKLSKKVNNFKTVFSDGCSRMNRTQQVFMGGMFIPALENLGDTQLKEKWMSKVHSYAIIGTYAQTEMGHSIYLQ